MTDIDQDSESIDTRPVRASAVVVALAIVGSAGVVFLLLEGVRHSVSLRPRKRNWDLVVPAEVSTLDTQLFAAETTAERAARTDRKRLESYGWVDVKQRRIHLPISVAIDLYLQERRSP